ncbi:IPP transferase-domain-containing protein [Lophiotrema nucula]|uniref:tRNA dimethylallyltransferase n=1 Tax=Lophiotrema nucula TaxID=690887 RepID=A0A6A5ZVP3_9PLEO|nr:IPP transferase-domain-containing protein [Lophiotrema nucula]
MSRAPMKPLVAIVGATGTGKSDLAVDLARRYNGEIINGDAMQLYQGLPIITNKITQDEMKGVPHHLLGCIGLEEETWTVGKFVGRALGVIDEIRSRGKLPILVGGTHYYTQSLLFQDVLADEPLLEASTNGQHFPILDEPTEVILEKLKEVDPVMADRWHPNERRKISRSLEIFFKTGKRASKIYEEQRLRRGISPNSSDSGINKEVGDGFNLRFPTLLFWVHAPKDVLYPRLDARIVKMLDKGLMAEVYALHDLRYDIESRSLIAGEITKPIDQTRGIWVSIGYKEFLEYLSARNDGAVSGEDLEKLKTAAVEKMQAATRQYANRQIRWIRIKLLNALVGAGQKRNMVLLDGSDLSKWEEQVLQPSRQITETFLSGNDLPEPTDLSALAREALTPKRDYDLAQRPELWQKRVCETCGIVAVTENDWNLHIKSRGHRRAVGAKKKQESAPQRKSKEPKAVDTDILDVFEDSLSQNLPTDDPR